MNKKQFENKEVYLWGLEQAKKSLLDKYDKGDQHPNRRQRRVVEDEVEEEEEEVEEVKPKKPLKREFTIGEDYGIDDLDFLNEEYEKIQEKFKTAKGAEFDELMDLEDKITELIEGLEHMKRLSGRGINKKNNEAFEGKEPKGEDSFNVKQVKGTVLKGKGFKKGSPEALEWAKKMREAKEAKKEGPSKSNVKKVVSSTKARVEKGSEEAKALGKRLAEAKKKKTEGLKKKEEVKPKPIKGKPYYYIGDIPKGYREASMIEAIKNNKVSKYGKYTVDENMYNYYQNFGILLNPDASDAEINVMLVVLKKKTMKELENVDIYKNKLENPKHKDKIDEYEFKLKDAKRKRKTYNAMFNWYLKLYKERHGGKYERIKLKLPEKVVKENYERPKNIIKEPIIDIRTGRPADEKIDEDDELIEFERGDEEIKLKRKYFDDKMKLKPKRAEQLYDKRILLEEKFYTPSDIGKYFFKELIKGGAIVFKKVNKY